MNNILTSNLTSDVTKGAIRGLFAQFGTIERIKIMTDRKTGQPTGVAFIEMEDDQAAERAIAAVNGAELNGRTLNVNAARPQVHRKMRAAVRCLSAGPGHNGE